MDTSALIGTGISVAVTLVSIGIAWGHLEKGQKGIDKTLGEISTDLKKIPDVYVRIDVQAKQEELTKLRDEMLRTTLSEIKEELKEIRKAKNE